MQTDKGGKRHTGWTKLHARTRGGIKHPGRQHDNHTGRDRDVDYRPASAPLAVLLAKAPPE